MNGRDFLPLAIRLAAGPTEADWRTAVDRAYYAAFHAARDLLASLRFAVPQSERAHAYLYVRLYNSGDAQVRQAAVDLHVLRAHRNGADYEPQRPFRRSWAPNDIQLAGQVIRVLDNLPLLTRNAITTAMATYERNILHDVTWQGP
jgi:hypothetical protein